MLVFTKPVAVALACTHVMTSYVPDNANPDEDSTKKVQKIIACWVFNFFFTFFDCEEACGISPACNGGVVCGWEEAPRDEWERRESRAGRSLNPTWTAV